MLPACHRLRVAGASRRCCSCRRRCRLAAAAAAPALAQLRALLGRHASRRRRALVDVAVQLREERQHWGGRAAGREGLRLQGGAEAAAPALPRGCARRATAPSRCPGQAAVPGSAGPPSPHPTPLPAVPGGAAPPPPPSPGTRGVVEWAAAGSRSTAQVQHVLPQRCRLRLQPLIGQRQLVDQLRACGVCMCRWEGGGCAALRRAGGHGHRCRVPLPRPCLFMHALLQRPGAGRAATQTAAAALCRPPQV